MQPLLAELIPPLLDLRDTPLVFFGHSMGALIAYEVALALDAQGVGPAHLCVSGCRAPHIARPDELHALPTELLLEAIRKMEGTPPQVLADESMMSLVLPILRADLELVETYRVSERRSVACRISAFGGNSDPRVSREDLVAWSEYSYAGFAQYEYVGGHFFIRDAEQELFAQLTELLNAATRRHPHARLKGA